MKDRMGPPKPPRVNPFIKYGAIPEGEPSPFALLIQFQIKHINYYMRFVQRSIAKARLHLAQIQALDKGGKTDFQDEIENGATYRFTLQYDGKDTEEQPEKFYWSVYIDRNGDGSFDLEGKCGDRNNELAAFGSVVAKSQTHQTGEAEICVGVMPPPKNQVAQQRGTQKILQPQPQGTLSITYSREKDRDLTIDIIRDITVTKIPSYRLDKSDADNQKMLDELEQSIQANTSIEATTTNSTNIKDTVHYWLSFETDAGTLSFSQDIVDNSGKSKTLSFDAEWLGDGSSQITITPPSEGIDTPAETSLVANETTATQCSSSNATGNQKIQCGLTSGSQQTRCADFNRAKNVYFGDLHVHTQNSHDVGGVNLEVSPEMAYKFAKGETITLSNGNHNLNEAQILDFAAVTDHAEGFVGKNVEWSKVRQAAWKANDPCNFTSFVAYEYTRASNSTMTHRNVIFKNQSTPASIVHANNKDYKTPSQLWDWMETECIGTPPCDVIAIPHNPNWSGGLHFDPEDFIASNDNSNYSDRFTQKQTLEPLMEIFQGKGASECQKDAIADTLLTGEEDANCDFENVSGKDTYLREELLKGLDYERDTSIGVNPFKVGFIGSTDTHTGLAGNVDERSFHGETGHDTEYDNNNNFSIRSNANNRQYNPGGLAAVWATQNTRTAIFNSLKSREVYMVTGPRISLRFYAGGKDALATACDNVTDASTPESSFFKKVNSFGVPMGGSLSNVSTFDPSAEKPSFVVWAQMDPAQSVYLQDIEIIKGTVDTNGNKKYSKVYALGGYSQELPTTGGTGKPCSDASLDQVNTVGFQSKCIVFTDENFDSSSHAYYYARVLENKTCRWSTYACNAAQNKGTPNPSQPCKMTQDYRFIQERAVSSPIWYSPEK